MKRILIVEDDKLHANMIKDTIKNSYPLWDTQIATSYDDGAKLIDNSVIEESPFDLFLFDIQLSKNPNDVGGFLLAEKLRNIPIYLRTPLLFLTSITDKISSALSNFHCYNYICKPYGPDEILEQVENLINGGYLTYDDTLELVSTDRIIHSIKIASIIYIKSSSHTITIHTVDECITTRQYSLNSIMQLLGPDFMRCHLSYIINNKFKTKIDKTANYITVNNEAIPIGFRYKKNFI